MAGRKEVAAVMAALQQLPASSSAAAANVPALLDPAVARKLLLTAATRQHVYAVQHLLKLPYMRQHLDAATLEAMLQQL
jgi:hypothetical protein